MKIFRLCKSRYSQDLSGHGAELSGGRWNSKGSPVTYANETISLCIAEIVVHFPLGMIPENYVLVTIEIPDELVKVLEINSLPDPWRNYPHSRLTQEIEDKFLTNNEFLVLKVPSAVVPHESNLLINPNHKDFNRIKILAVEPYTFDERLFR